jgi:hypothetical protein
LILSLSMILLLISDCQDNKVECPIVPVQYAVISINILY